MASTSSLANPTGRAPLSCTITLLHLSDIQFGRNHRFGRLGLPEPDAPFDTLFARLCDDLRLLKDEHGLAPDLVIASGDLAEEGKIKEFEDVLALLTGLTEVLGLPRERVVIVPGNHDINRKSCLAYFADCEADEQPPVAPYWSKWKHFYTMFRAFYGNAAGIEFSPDEPWSWYEHDDLKLVVAGLNSTMAESHLEKDHHGYLGEKQLRWFADNLRAYKGEGWFRLGVMHHNYQRGVPSDDESLHDADDLRRHLIHQQRRQLPQRPEQPEARPGVGRAGPGHPPGALRRAPSQYGHIPQQRRRLPQRPGQPEARSALLLGDPRHAEARAWWRRRGAVSTWPALPAAFSAKSTRR